MTARPPDTIHMYRMERAGVEKRLVWKPERGIPEPASHLGLRPMLGL